MTRIGKICFVPRWKAIGIVIADEYFTDLNFNVFGIRLIKASKEWSMGTILWPKETSITKETDTVIVCTGGY